jgi:hypothetical protein
VENDTVTETNSQGPALFAPTNSSVKATSKNRASRTSAEEAPPPPATEPVAPAILESANEQSGRERPFPVGLARDAEHVARALHTETADERQIPPSAFSGDRPIARRVIRSTPVDSAAEAEELPAPNGEPGRLRQPAPSPNTDLLLMNQPADDFVLDGAPLAGPDGEACDTCGPSCAGCAHGPNWLENLCVFAGPQAFKGSPDNGVNGNFGLHYGLNWGAPFWYARRIGYQVGGQVVHSNFSGSNTFLPTSASRTQFFLTAGLFQRAVPGNPWQWGVAFDWLEDHYYIDMHLGKIRSELSFVGSMGDEIGAWTSVAVNHDNRFVRFGEFFNGVNITSSDLFAFFYRRHFCNLGNGRLWGGFTGNGDGLIGGDFRVPMSDTIAFEGNANYLIPKNGGISHLNQEAWAINFNLVFYFGRGAMSSTTSPWRPLFNVADNSVFLMGAH